MGKYIISKIDGLEYCKINGQFSRHLRNNGITYQEYYEKYITGKVELCSCGKSKTFYQHNHTYASSCGDSICVGKTIREVKSRWSDEKRKTDSENKSRAMRSRSVEEVKMHVDKIKETQILKYGSLACQTDEFKEKSKLTKLQRYGNEYYAGWEKSANTNRTKTTDEKNAINEKRRNTNLALYGIECPLMRPDILKKSMVSNGIGKEYTMPSGKIVRVRGYENIWLDMIFADEIYAECELIIDDMSKMYSLPLFTYKTVERQVRKYYPDIYVPSKNLIIEIKGRWWYDGNGDLRYANRLENNMRKKQAVIDGGYNYQLWVFENKKDYIVYDWFASNK